MVQLNKNWRQNANALNNKKSDYRVDCYTFQDRRGIAKKNSRYDISHDMIL